MCADSRLSRKRRYLPAIGEWYGFRAGVCALLLVLVAGCAGESDPEREIRAWLEAAEAEVEERDRSALVARIAPGYTDARDNDRDALDGLLRYYFLRQRNVTVVTAVESVDVSAGTAAEVALTAGIAGTGGAQGLDADARRFVLSLVKRDGDWLLTSAKWGRLGEEPR